MSRSYRHKSCFRSNMPYLFLVIMFCLLGVLVAGYAK